MSEMKKKLPSDAGVCGLGDDAADRLFVSDELISESSSIGAKLALLTPFKTRMQSKHRHINLSYIQSLKIFTDV